MQNSFREKFPHITVDLRHLQDIKAPAESQAGNYPKMWALVAAEDLGDVFAWDPSHWVFYNAIRREVVRPIDDFVARDKLDLSQWFEPFIDYQQFQGKMWGLPELGVDRPRWDALQRERCSKRLDLEFPDVKSPDYSMESLYELAVQANQFHQRNGGFGIRTTLPGSDWCDHHLPGVQHGQPDAGRQEVHRLFRRQGPRGDALGVRPLEQRAGDGGGQGPCHPSVARRDQLQRREDCDPAGGIVERVRRHPHGGRQGDSPLFSFKSALFPRRTDGKRPSQAAGWHVGRWVSRSPVRSIRKRGTSSSSTSAAGSGR